MGMTAKLVRDDRSAYREVMDVGGTLRNVQSVPLDVVIEDLSATGFRMRTRSALDIDEIILVGIPALGRRRARVVRRTPEGFGCEFLAPIDPSLVTAAPSTKSVANGDFGGSINEGLVRTWAAANDPDVGKYSGMQRLAIVSVLAAGGWLAIIGLVSLL